MIWPFTLFRNRNRRCERELEFARHQLADSQRRVRELSECLRTAQSENETHRDYRDRFTARIVKAKEDARHPGRRYRVQLIPNAYQDADGERIRGFNYRSFNTTYEEALANARHTGYPIEQSEG